MFSNTSGVFGLLILWNGIGGIEWGQNSIVNFSVHIPIRVVGDPILCTKSVNANDERGILCLDCDFHIDGQTIVRSTVTISHAILWSVHWILFHI